MRLFHWTHVARPYYGSGQRRRRVALDRWGLFLAAVTSDGDDWRLHHDAVGHVIFSDALRAGIIGSTEVRGIFADLLPRQAATSLQSRREGLVPDARLSRTIEGRTAEYLHDLKVLHWCPTRHSLPADDGAT